jgi:hypothetical protein
MRRRNVTIWAMVVVLLATGISRADLVGYVATWSEVYLTDFSGTNTSLGQSGIVDIRAIDISPIDGILYAADDSGQLWTVDTATGVGSLIGNMGRRIDSMSFAPDGTLYAIHNGTSLRSINTSTAVATAVGSTWSYNSIAVAINNNNTAIAWDHTTQYLFEIDLSNGSTTSLGYLEGSDFDAFDYGPDGVLYAYDEDDSKLYSVDVDNLTFAYEGSSVYGRSMATIPEPATLLLLGLGGIVFHRRSCKVCKL